MRANIEKLSENENEFRGAFEGELHQLPEMGKSFIMTGEPLEKTKGDVRIFKSSEVQKITKEDNVYTLNTENSVYKLTILERL